MRNPTRRRLVILMLMVGLGVIGIVPATAQTQSDVDAADAQREHAYEDLVDANEAVGLAIAALEAIGEELHELDGTIDGLDRQISGYALELQDLEAIARQVVIEAYVGAGTELLATALAVSSLQDLATGQALTESAAAHDIANLDRLSAVNRKMERLRVELEAGRARVAKLQQDQQEEAARLEDSRAHAERVLDTAEANYKEVVEQYRAELRRQAEAEAKRRRAAAAASSGESSRASSAAAGLPPSSTTGVVCPVGGNTWFVDTWGAPRSGGRTHKGTDMAAAYGTPLVAMYGGSIRLGWSTLGGRQLYLYADNGNFYYYAHLSNYPSGLSNGQRVDRGQVVGYVGSTGNATANVLHLGMGPSPNNWVNPYATVRAVC